MTELLADGARVERIADGCVWAEGPVWLPAERAVLWSDIPNDRILRFDEATGTTRVHRQGVEFTNGRTLDGAGHIVQCSHGLRRIERERDGRVEPIVSAWGAVRFNSPNDVVVASDGAIWFTDPPYGILSDHEGHAAEPEYEGCHVFRYDEPTGRLDAVITDMRHPNGLAFSPDESVLYVSDTHPDAPAHVRAYPLHGDQVGRGADFARVSSGVSDGIRVDTEGRIWSSSGSGVDVFASDGAAVGTIQVPEPTANLCFGGTDGQTLYLTATTSVYRVRVRARDAHATFFSDREQTNML